MSRLLHVPPVPPRSSRRSRVALPVAATACLALVVPAAAAAPASAAPPAAVRAASAASPSSGDDLQDLVQKAVDAGVTGLLVRQDDGKHAVRAVAGVSRVEPRRDLEPGDATRIGSITKTFVSTVLLQLAAEGRLRLDDRVERHLPGLVPGGKQITVRMLLNHTSGLYNYTEDPTVLATVLGTDGGREWTPQQLLDVVRKHDPAFAPGTAWGYSNTNYIVAGLLIEHLTGRDADDVITQRIIRPLRLRGTYLASTPQFRGPHIHGYARTEDGRLVDASKRPISWAWTAGAMVSTADDLDTFLAALMGGRLLPPAQLKEMKTAAPQSKAFGLDYGLGLYSAKTPCGVVWGHDGGLPGYSTIAYTDETGRRSAILFLPTQPTEAMAPAIQAAALSAMCGMFGKPVPAQASAGSSGGSSGAAGDAPASGAVPSLPTGSGRHLDRAA